jgi:hypothetical protein
MLVVIQAAIIIGLVAAVWMYRNRYVKRSKLSTSIHTQSTVINAYETPCPINAGTLRHSESLRSPTRPMISKTYSAGEEFDIYKAFRTKKKVITHGEVANVSLCTQMIECSIPPARNIF